MISFSDDSDVTDSKVSSSARICRSLKVNSHGTVPLSCKSVQVSIIFVKIIDPVK